MDLEHQMLMDEIKENCLNITPVLIYPQLQLKNCLTRDEVDLIRRGETQSVQTSVLFEILKKKKVDIFCKLQNIAWTEGHEDFCNVIRQTLVDSGKQDLLWTPPHYVKNAPVIPTAKPKKQQETRQTNNDESDGHPGSSTREPAKQINRNYYEDDIR